MYEATNVHLGDYTSETTEQRITCTDEELRHSNHERAEPSIETIAVDEISAIRRDTDKSQAGFKRIGYAFAAFGLVFSFMAVPFVLAGVLFTPIAGGSFLSAALCWYGFAMFYRMERGTLDVLEIRANGEWYRFFTRKESTTFDEILSRLPDNVVNGSIALDRAGR